MALDPLDRLVSRFQADPGVLVGRSWALALAHPSGEGAPSSELGWAASKTPSSGVTATG
jgi:hypothetical protein